MNELERAAHELVAHPVASPAPMAELERRAGEVRRRQQAMRVLSVAAAVMVLLVGVVGAAAIRQKGETDLQTAAATDAATPTQFDVAWEGDASVSDSLARLIEARLSGYGASDVSVVRAGERRLAVSANGITYESASLLVRTKGILATAVFQRAAALADCPNQSRVSIPTGATVTTGATVFTASARSSTGVGAAAGVSISLRSVGWPNAETVATCFNAMGAVTDLGTAVVGAAEPPSQAPLKASVEQEGASSGVHVVQPAPSNGSTRTTFGTCAESMPPQCVGLLLDGELMREPDSAGFAPLGEKPELEDAADGFIIRGFAGDEAKIFAAVVNGGAHKLELFLLAKGEGEIAMPATSMPGSTVTTTAADEDLVDVFVAAQFIRRGSSGADVIASGAIKASKIPREFRPSSAIESMDAINAKVALFDIAANTVIVNGMFVDCCGENPASTVHPTPPPTSSTTAPAPPTAATPPADPATKP